MPADSIIRIALIGPESTGKTSLARKLAAHYKTTWVPEYAREYIDKLNRDYTMDDILLIARKHLENEKSLTKDAHKLIFVDTEFILAKVWCEDKFGYCPEWIMQQADKNTYDLYLLTATDLPWKTDSVRENPDRRDFLFELYRKELVKRRLRYSVISGLGDARFLSAIESVESAIKSLR